MKDLLLCPNSTCSSINIMRINWILGSFLFHLLQTFFHVGWQNGILNIFRINMSKTLYLREIKSFFSQKILIDSEITKSSKQQMIGNALVDCCNYKFIVGFTLSWCEQLDHFPSFLSITSNITFIIIIIQITF